MSDKPIGSIYPAALIGRAPLLGNIYMPYRLIFSSDRVIAFYPNAEKGFKSSFKLFKAYGHRASKWKEMLATVKGNDLVSYGMDGLSDDMLRTAEGHGYGSLTYDNIGAVLLRSSPDPDCFNMLFRPTGTMLVRGLEFCTSRSALEESKKLLKLTPLSAKMESEI